LFYYWVMAVPPENFGVGISLLVGERLGDEYTTKESGVCR
jgi:hypothetical protein